MVIEPADSHRAQPKIDQIPACWSDTFGHQNPALSSSEIFLLRCSREWYAVGELEGCLHWTLQRWFSEEQKVHPPVDRQRLLSVSPSFLIPGIVLGLYQSCLAVNSATPAAPEHLQEGVLPRWFVLAAARLIEVDLSCPCPIIIIPGISISSVD